MALVCDDDPVVSGVVGHLVADHGWEQTCEVSSALDAIELAGRFHPDLVVLDVALLGMSGLEALPRIHAVSPTSRVIVLSSYDEALHLALAAGATAVFTKSDLLGLQSELFRLAPGHDDGLADHDEDALDEDAPDEVSASTGTVNDLDPANATAEDIELVLQAMAAAARQGR